MSENLRETYVRDFQKCMGQDIDIPYNPKALYLRMNLIKEELNELQDEVEKSIFEFKENSGQINKETKQNILKELCDLMYVVSGFAVTFGLPVQVAFNRVHKSNMSKLVNGIPQLNDWGKVQKGKNYKPPNMEDLV
jgi:predicted HAD superfamily Cof-like phosphohydrolase